MEEKMNLITILDLLSGDGIISETKKSKQEHRMPLTMLEKYKLSSLGGKAKKRYIKELKAKYLLSTKED
jgi:hypothetical protein